MLSPILSKTQSEIIQKATNYAMEIDPYAEAEFHYAVISHFIRKTANSAGHLVRTSLGTDNMSVNIDWVGLLN